MWVAFLVHWEVNRQGHLTYIFAMVEEVSARGIFHRAVWCLLMGFGCALFSAVESTQIGHHGTLSSPFPSTPSCGGSVCMLCQWGRVSKYLLLVGILGNYFAVTCEPG